MRAGEVENLHNFLLQKDLDRIFDYRVLSRAAGLTYGDPEVLLKLNSILEELKCRGHISWYIAVGNNYWIRG